MYGDDMENMYSKKFETMMEIDQKIIDRQKARLDLVDIIENLDLELNLIKSDILVNINSEKLGDKPVYSNEKSREAELSRRLNEHVTYNEKKDQYINSIRSKNFIDIEIESLKRKWDILIKMS